VPFFSRVFSVGINRGLAMDATQLFRSGDLSGAVAAQIEVVKGKPTDASARTFLFELFCFAGELDRAEKQLEVIGHQSVEAQWPAQVYANLLYAERARRRVFDDGVAPQFLIDPPEYITRHVEAAAALAKNKISQAVELLESAAEHTLAVNGTLEERSFKSIADSDELLAPVLEVMLQRDYAWIPWSQIRELEVAKPERPRDLVWTPGRVVLTDGKQQRVYLPMQYVGSHKSEDDRLRLGRMTDWFVLDDGPARGLGQHTLLIDDEEVGLLSCRNLVLNT
jgi:type VI secretion system protein ImpE